MLVDCGNIQVKVGLLYLAQKRVTRKKPTLALHS